MLIALDGMWMLRGEITTSRLTLRAHRPTDLDDVAVFHADPEVTRYIPWPVRSRSQTEAALDVKVRQNVARDGDWLVLAIVHSGDQRVIGEALLKRRTPREAEIGYVLSRQYQGAGYASEAVGALIHEAHRGLGIARLTAVVDGRNAASIRLLLGQGFTVIEGVDELGGEITLELALPRHKDMFAK
jgi:RimJ/RimL family protein N-acetyltransferase